MIFTTAVHTDKGIKKQTNQDSSLIIEAKSDSGNILLTVICDGMGGLAKGEVASSTVIQTFCRWFEQELPGLLAFPETLESRIFSDWDRLIDECNRKIATYGRTNGVGMGTTLNALLFIGERYFIVNIGDSRAYRITDHLEQLTKDQTYIQREMDMGRMTPEEARVSPQRNVLLQCIGASDFIEPDYSTGVATPGQIYMQCSDGFRHAVSADEIYQYLNPGLLLNEQALLDNAVYLVELNKYRLEVDNITVVVIRTD